jgi:hypothetical protein
MINPQNPPIKNKVKGIIARMPSIFWIILIPLGLVVLIGVIIIAFYCLANIEGFASLIMIGTFFLSIKFIGGNQEVKNYSKKVYSGLWTAGLICFFALMGMAIDQPGNLIYNKPIEIFFCPEESHLNRDVFIRHPLPERTDMVQMFDCVNGKGDVVYSVSTFQIIGTRFVEYVLIAYILIGIVRIFSIIKKR